MIEVRSFGQVKGQYFLLGAIIIITLFFTGFYLVKNESIFSSSYKADDLKYLFYNMQSEYPRVFNYGINESDITVELRNFTEFSRSIYSSNILNFTTLLIYTTNISDNLNVTIVNYLGYDTEVELNISGTLKNLTVTDEGLNSTIFSAVNPKFVMTVKFNSQEKQLSMVRDKYNLYTYLQLRRKSEIIKGSVLA
ncbi:MAG: hypothetical protein JW716_05780 [Candidatus Aenigmarchaeota archaeon]|nr:hypothetical protein [Candidatus Aenigmarchaeota archaeon]